MNHHATPEFWQSYRSLPLSIQRLADRCFAQLKNNPRHPSLQMKKVGRFYSARVGLHYRAVGVGAENGILWFWIGPHAAYDKIVS